MFWETDFFKSFPKHFYFQLKISNLIFFNKTKVDQNIIFFKYLLYLCIIQKSSKNNNSLHKSLIVNKLQINHKVNI